MNPLGAVVALGFAGGWWEPLDPAPLVGRNLGIFGFYLGRLMRFRPEVVRDAIAEIVALWESGAVKPLVGATFALDDVADAHRLVEERRQRGQGCPRSVARSSRAGAPGSAPRSSPRSSATASSCASLDIADGFDVSDPDVRGRQSSAVDLACLNAGVVTGERLIARVSDEQYRRIVGVNVDGVVFGVRRLARVMHEGSIVVTASLAGLTAMENDPLYALTKHALVGFVRSVAPQLAERGIRLNMVNPGDRRHAVARRRGTRHAARGGVSRCCSRRTSRPRCCSPRKTTRSARRGSCSRGASRSKFRFPGVPGPRVEGAEGMVPQL